MNLFVANISREVKEDALKALFSEFGVVKSSKIVNDRVSGISKGFGFIEMPNDQEAMEAMRRLSHAAFFGQNLVVSKAREKTSAF